MELLIKDHMLRCLKFVLILPITCLLQIVVAQDPWPLEAAYIVDIADNRVDSIGEERYGSGHLRAQGPLKVIGTKKYYSRDHREGIQRPVYERSGHWVVYYDSSVSIILSEGKFAEGKKDGPWKVFDRNG